MEQKKLLWVIFSAVGFVFIVAAAGLVLFWPHDQKQAGEGEQAAASVARDFDPVEWVRKEQEYPGIDETEAEEGEEMILVYGDSGEEGREAGPAAAEEGPSAGKEADKTAVTGKDGVEIEVYRPEKVKEKQTAEPVPSPEPEPETKRLTEYWIQAGSYTSMVRAEEVKQDLSQRGIASLITSKTVDGTDYYRVRIGPYGSEAEAEKFLGWIRGVSGFESSYVSMVYVTRRIN